MSEGTLTSVETHGGKLLNITMRKSQGTSFQSLVHEDNVGVVTGNWGCGAFGGDPELKAIIQWLAASQVVYILNLKTKQPGYSKISYLLFELK